MPYQGEYAQYQSIRRLAENERIHELLNQYEISTKTQGEIALPESLNVEELETQNWSPKYVLAIDGSHHEVKVENGYPGAEASYLTVSSVLIDHAKMISLDQQRPVDPKIFRTLEHADSIDWALPGANVIYAGELNAKASFRRSIFELLSKSRSSEDGETLLDTYEALLAYKPEANQQCPFEDDCFHSKGEYLRGKGCYTCQCSLANNLYSTDALRVHERMTDAGTNGAIFGELMQVIERIWIIHILRTLESRNWLGWLDKIAIVLDGPLAVFGQPAWLSKAISQELIRLNKKIQQATGRDLLFLGIEKSGMFLDHFLQLDRNKDGSTGRIANGTVFLLDDKYIKQHIIFSDSERLYGHSTYFGRKAFYKTRSGAFLVFSLPFLSSYHENIKLAKSDQYPRLNDSVFLLDRLVSSRYTNAITPIVAAHAEAAIPLHLGNKILEQLARELTKQNRR